jgi:LysM repeat protein
MKWKGTEEDPEFTEGALDDDEYDEDDYPVWEKQRKFSLSDSLFKKIEIPFILMAVGLVVVLVVFFVSMAGKDNNIEVARIETLEKRLGSLEDRLFKMEGTDIQIKSVGQQDGKIEALQGKVLQLETDITSRMDRISTDLSKLSKKSSVSIKATPAPRGKTTAKAAASQPLYHQVRSGDTLFGIGIQYGISVEEISKLNKLSSKKVIHPGQKLIVGAPKAR